MDELPPIGSIVRYGRILYEVAGHRCATNMSHCPNGERAISAYQLNRKGFRRYTSPMCIPGDQVTVEVS